jgi:lysozyme family protein
MGLKFSDLRNGYSELWKTMVIKDGKRAATASQATKIKGKEELYRKVSGLTGVPWQVVGIIHSLESNCDDQTHLHNGDPLTARTRRVPKGRPIAGGPSFTWIESAVDALKSHDLDAIKDWPVERIAFELERYNGLGYRKAPGRGNSPYLWSFTNHYTKGKFESDGDFNPNLVSDQVGGMALLKELAGDTAQVQVQADPAQPPIPVVSNVIPLTTGMFVPTGPFELLPSVTAQPGAAQDPDVIEEDELIEKIREHGERWEIKVHLKGGGTKQGFARGGIFTPQATDPVVDPEGFALECLNAARLNQTSAHHLIAVADVETGIRNVAAKSGDGVGPFLIGEKAWANATAGGIPALAPTARFDPLKQPFVAAKMAAEDAAALRSGPTSPLPTSAELYVAKLIGAQSAKTILGNLGAGFRSSIAPADAGIDPVRPWIFEGNADVKTTLERIARALDVGYERAEELLRRVEPDLELEKAVADGMTTGFASRLRETSIAEWKFFGEQARNVAGTKTKDGHKETEARVPLGSGENWFARVGTYWREGVGILGRDGRVDIPWSAAFISYAVKKANPAGRFHYSPRHAVYISKAIRDFNDQNQDAGYWCKRLPDHQPKVGDIVCWARESGVDYDHQKGGDYAGHTDIVVDVRQKEIDVIGGNVGQSVTKRALALDANGCVKGGRIQGEDLFGIMENRIP